MHVNDAYVSEFQGRNSVKGGGENVKQEKNSIFLKKGKTKTVISVENKKFSISRMMKRTAPLNSSREI